MEIEIAIPPLRNKLLKLLADGVITDRKLEGEVKELINKLESFTYSSKDADSVYAAEDATDEFILTTEVQRQNRTSQLRSRQSQKNYTRKLEDITQSFNGSASRMDREQSKRSSGDQIGPTEDTVQRENIPSNLDEASYIAGLENDWVKRLLDYENKTQNSCVIPVMGVARSGETTDLVRKIYNRVDIKQHFECRAWVHVSKRPEGRSLLADIMKQFMVMTKEQELPNEALMSKLPTFLEKKRYLIVLDGVCTKDVWDSLRENSLSTGSGKIILTTVDADVAQLSLLSEKESWALFLNKVTVSVAQQTKQEILPLQLYLLTTEKMWPLLSKKVTVIEGDLKMPDFIHLREQILRTCNGVPLAILLLGGLLSTINLNEWSRVIKPEIPVPDILAMSYQGLRYELKSCLLYMFLFQREYEIPVRRLFGLWISEDMVVKPSSGEGRVAEDMAEIYFNELVGRNMIEVTKWRSDGRPKACRMPGIIYDFLLPKDSEMRSLCFKTPIPSTVRRCADYLDIERYPLEIESLRSCVSFDTRQRGTPALGIGMLLIRITSKRSFGLLTVLDLEGVYKPVLPKVLGKLLLVKYLGLRSTVIDSLPESVGELQRLETLDVKHTNITSLPSSILKGKRLQHLYLNGINLDMSIKQQSIGSAGDLQTLSGISIVNKNSIENGFDRYTGLRKLELTCHSTAMKAVVDWIKKLTNLRTLKLKSVETFLQPSEFVWEPEMKKHCNLSHLYFHGKLNPHELPVNLEILTLSLSKLAKDPMPILGELRHLKTLRLLAKSYGGKQMNCDRGKFPQLRTLKLWMLEELQEWIVEEGAMPCLRELEIRGCEKLKEPVGLQHVATLKELILTNMPVNFEADIKRSMGSDVFINTNKLKLPPSDLWLD